MFGTVLVSEESRELRLLEVPAPVSPGMFGMLPDRLEKEEVWMGYFSPSLSVALLAVLEAELDLIELARVRGVQVEVEGGRPRRPAPTA
jgi:hypothetical protein